MSRKCISKKEKEERFRLFTGAVIAIEAVGIGFAWALIVGMHIHRSLDWLPPDVLLGKILLMLIIPSVIILTMGIYATAVVIRKKKTLSGLSVKERGDTEVGDTSGREKNA